MSKLIEVLLSAEAKQAASSESFVVGVKNAKGDEPAEIVLYDTIGDSWIGTDARSVTEFLRHNKGSAVNVRINSPGGLAYDGITIHNALVSHDGPVTTEIEGMAGSAASIIAMAGNTVKMWDNANLFIHRASLIAIGNTDVMEEARDWLAKLDEAIAGIYKNKTGLPLPKIRSLMKGKVDGTVFSAAEAKKDGWIDEIVKPGKKAKAVGDAKPVLRQEAMNRYRSIEASRAERLRTRRDLFGPAE